MEGPMRMGPSSEIPSIRGYHGDCGMANFLNGAAYHIQDTEVKKQGIQIAESEQKRTVVESV